MRVAARIELTPAERQWLDTRARDRSLPAGLAQRCRIVLLAAAGQQDTTIAAALGITRAKAARWRQRFLQRGAAGLEKDAPRRGRTPAISAAVKADILRRTTQEAPAHAPHWTTRTMAAAAGVSPATVRRLWAAHGLAPARAARAPRPRQLGFAARAGDLVGLYLNPPAHALALGCDEHSPTAAALDPSLPGLPGGAHPAASLLATLRLLDRRLAGPCQPAPGPAEWIQFLRRLDLATPPGQQLHLILDHRATHQHPGVRRWLARHPRFQVHFTPARASWLKLAEPLLRDLAWLRRGALTRAANLIEAIHAHLGWPHHPAPKPFAWTAGATALPAAVARTDRGLHPLPRL